MNIRMNTALGIRRSNHLHLPTLASSVACSRLFVQQVCTSWQIGQEQIDDATLLASELISNAIVASKVTEPLPVRTARHSDVKLIGMRLVDLGHSLVIEVWDTSSQPPKLTQPSLEAEHGRGLQLVDALSIRWGHYTCDGGKVVWCQLALSSEVLESDAADDAEAFQRALEVLQAQEWDEQV